MASFLTCFGRIRITFSIADLASISEDPDRFTSDDDALSDEPSDLLTDTQSGGANTKGAVNQGRTKGGNIAVAPEDRIAPADRPELADEEDTPADEDGEPSFPARVSVMVEKDGKGTLNIEAVAQDGMIGIENVHYFPTGDVDDAKSYAGPPFGNLDQDLQVLFERYLEERAVDARLALWVPEYIDWKEQREYLRWLGGKCDLCDKAPMSMHADMSLSDVKGFVDA